MQLYVLGLALIPIVGASEITEEFAREFMKHHNKNRCMHGAKMATWNWDVARSALEWASNPRSGTEMHDKEILRSLNDPEGPASENWAKGMSTPEGAVNAWYGEVRKLTAPYPTTMNEYFSIGAAHFTTVVWKYVNQIGCAHDEETGSWVCRYKTYNDGKFGVNWQGGLDNGAVSPPVAGATIDTCLAEAEKYWEADRKFVKAILPKYPNAAAAFNAMGGDFKKFAEEELKLTSEEASLLFKHFDNDDSGVIEAEELELRGDDGSQAWGEVPAETSGSGSVSVVLTILITNMLLSLIGQA